MNLTHLNEFLVSLRLFMIFPVVLYGSPSPTGISRLKTLLAPDTINFKLISV